MNLSKLLVTIGSSYHDLVTASCGSLLTRPYFKENSGLLNIESNHVQSLIFTRAVFQILRKMYAHNYLTFQNIISKTNSQMVKGSKGDSVINCMIGPLDQRLNFFARQNKE